MGSALSNIVKTGTLFVGSEDNLTSGFEFIAGTLLSEVFFSSRPYPTQVIDNLTTSYLPERSEVLTVVPEGIQGAGFSIIAGAFVGSIHSYTNGLPEGIQGTGFAIDAGTLQLALITYTNGLPEGIQGTGFDLIGGTLALALITYNNYPPEGLQTTGFSMTAGTLV